jgi:peptidoglycan-N-acetylglucosamine deacetylase
MNTREKIFYHLAEILFLQRKPVLSTEVSGSKKLFLYFDYEREFSGFKTDITNEEVFKLIDILNKYKFKSTWFTVGKVIENYFPTIAYLLDGGHEIGSHTYSHFSPYEITENQLLEDYLSFNETIRKYDLEIKGFHSPKNKWNRLMFDYLKNFEYSYDVYCPKQKKYFFGKEFEKIKMKSIIRLISLGDDWVLYNQTNSREEVFAYFKSLFEKIQPGSIRGIGVHPWVLYSDQRIFLGYKDFLEFLSTQNDLIIDTAKNYYKEILEMWEIQSLKKSK